MHFPSHLIPRKVTVRSALLLTSVLLLGSAAVFEAYGHGGEIEVGESAQGPVFLNATQEKAIGLQRVAADFRPLAELLNLNGEVELLSNRQADVSSRISGQVTALYVTLGQAVRAGQPLVRVQSRLVGDPPPSVNVASPLNGIVDAVNVVLGQSVDPATLMLHVSDTSQVNMVARVYEQDLGKIHLGQETRVRALSYPDSIFTGKVSLIGPTLNPESRTAEVWTRLANPGALLKSHMFARASIILRQNDAALTVPTAAIIAADNEKFVFVRQGDKYDRVDITVGANDDEYTEVTDGLVPGDEVVTQGNREIYTLWLTGGGKKEGAAPGAAKNGGE